MDDYVLIEDAETNTSTCDCKSILDLQRMATDLELFIEQKELQQYTTKEDACKSLSVLFDAFPIHVRYIRRHISEMMYAFSSENQRIWFVNHLMENHQAIFEYLFSDEHDMYQSLNGEEMNRIIEMCDDLVMHIEQKNNCHHCSQHLHNGVNIDEDGLVSSILTTL